MNEEVCSQGSRSVIFFTHPQDGWLKYALVFTKSIPKRNHMSDNDEFVGMMSSLLMLEK
jgi:hypothetical protein